MNKNKVLVGLSGGVDSSVTAALLLEQGYEVIGVTITPFKVDANCRPEDNPRNCCSYQGMSDANEICKVLGIEHKLIDLTEKFKKEVVDVFVDDYLNGRTPNPCVICNPKIKWGELLQIADEMDVHFVAMGHYAKVRYDENLNRYILSKGDNPAKDQSYFLWKLSQEQLSRTLFPLGEIKEKSETRAIAKKNNLPVFDKIESQEICFVPNDDYHTFLLKNVENINEKIGEGDILFEGNKVGRHKGYPFYTIGQRKGLGVTHPVPLYVKKIFPETNTIEVGENDSLNNTGLLADSVNYIKYPSLDEKREFIAKIRYKDKGTTAECHLREDGKLEVRFSDIKRAITPGQSVVIYEGDDVVCGGIIREEF